MFKYIFGISLCLRHRYLIGGIRMRRRYYSKNRRAEKHAALIIKRLFFLLCVCAAVHFMPESAEKTAEALLRAVGENEKLSAMFLNIGLSAPLENRHFSPLSLFFPIEIKEQEEDKPAEQEPEKIIDEKEPEKEPIFIEENESIIPTTITGEGSSRYALSGGIYFNNKTEYTLDGRKLLSEGSKITVKDDGPQVLIIHSHGSEAYTPSGYDVYEESDPSRTEDKNFNVVRVGDELMRVFEEMGIEAVHDRELYDYPSYSGSYTRSLEAMENYLEEYPSIKIVLDIHRDALEGDGKTYKTVADIKSAGPCSQIMLVVGTDFSGLNHPNWRENLSFAALIQKKMTDKYPSLARPLTVSGSRYNQHVTTGSLIVEVGTNGNTLQESLTAIRLFAECAGEVILELKE